MKQMWQVFQMTRRYDPTAQWLMLLGFLAPVLAGLVVALWRFSPVLVLGGITVLYGGLAALLLWRIKVLFKDRKALECSVQQLRRDATLINGCLKEALSDSKDRSRAIKP